MVDAVVSFAVERLGDFLIQKIVLHQRVKTNVEWLRDELRYMQSFLKDAEEKQGGDYRVQQWIFDITNVADDTLNVLKSYASKAERGGRTNHQGLINQARGLACICCNGANMFDIGAEIGSIRERVSEISRRRETYGISNISIHGLNNTSAVRTLRRATSYADDQLFVGFEDVTERLSKELLKEEPCRCVISIYGMGGLGKTTLARQLYNSASVANHFPYRAWVCVSQEYGTQELLRSIIKSFKKRCSKDELEMFEIMTEDDLERYLREFLKGKKYLVVVDDVWQKEAWQILRRGFLDSKNGSRVIITTRKKDVAEGVDDRSFVHELRFLTPEESWDLFSQKLSHGTGSIDWRTPPLQKLGRDMVEKCGGLPLAIEVLGGLLSHRNGLDEWHKVKDHIWQHMRESNSIEISHLLSLSYYDLPSKLKQCFLYLGMFPEDYLIDTEKLVWLWMAEGFLSDGDERMEDDAECCLNELVNRSLIQVARRYWGKITGCRIHDLLRDLAVQKASEVNFLDIYDPRIRSTTLLRRRHAIHTHVERYFSLGIPNSKLRSLVFFNSDKERVGLEKLTSVCEELGFLCVLDLKNILFSRSTSGLLPVPDNIGNLIHLKFLGLNGTNFSKFPASIGNLRSLQTLEAFNVDSVRCEFPRELSKLISLRHLVAYSRGPLHIDTLTNLQTLRWVDYGQWSKIDTTGLVSLRELAMNGIGSSSSLDSISRLENLATLQLQTSHSGSFPPLEPLSACRQLVRLHLNGKINKLPSFQNLPKSLVLVVLLNSQLREDPMPVLGRLPNLRNLELQGAYEGKQMTCEAKGFCQLEFLRLSDMNEVKTIHINEGAMSVIKGLGIYRCPKLNVPERLTCIPVLNESD